MPLYEYRCTACDRLTEKRQKFSDPEITDCPYCGGKLERTITAPAVQFKGGGWYADVYGNKKPAAASGGDGAATTGGETKAAGGGETGPAAGESKGETKAAASAPAAAAPASAAPSSTPSE